MYKIKVSLLNEDGKEIDFVTRDFISYATYNFPKGILINLLILLNRNSLLYDWLGKQFDNLKLLEP